MVTFRVVYLAGFIGLDNLGLTLTTVYSDNLLDFRLGLEFWMKYHWGFWTVALKPRQCL